MDTKKTLAALLLTCLTTLAMTPVVAADHAERAARTGFLILCGPSYDDRGVACDTLHGDYGYGTIRLCRGSWWDHVLPPVGGTVGDALRGTGACDTYTASNMTLTAARALDGVLG